MTKWFIAFTVMMSVTTVVQARDNAYFQLQEPEIHEGPTVTLNPRSFTGAIGSALCAEANPQFHSGNWNTVNGLETAPAILDDIGMVSMVLDQVVNLGKKIWALVEAGKPVVNLKTDVATALPYGAKCWLDLQTWSAPKAKTYTVTYKNLYGVDVVKFSYRVIFVSGGSVNGQGAYIGYAAIEPSDVYVAWGFNLNAESAAPTIYNMGTKEAPVAGMNLQMNYSVNTVLQTMKASRAYFISGQGELQALD